MTMPLNKTFLLTAVADYTEGSMLIVIDSLDEFLVKFKAYHAKKRDFMLPQVPVYYNRSPKTSIEKWHKACEKRNELENQFIIENNSKPFNFEFSTGCSYSKEGPGKDHFYDNVRITRDSKGTNYWLVVREFMSDLPTGTPYLGDYCS